MLLGLTGLEVFLNDKTYFTVMTPCLNTHLHKIIQLQVFEILSVIARTPAKFTQLKRNKRFDNSIMLVGVQGSLFHIAAVSHPVQKGWRSQDSLNRGQIQKLLQCFRDP